MLWWKIKFQFLYFIIWNINYLVVNGLKLKPTMVGEPLNPFDFENAIKLVIDKTLENDLNYDDGTLDDIIKPKQVLRNTFSATPWTNGILPYLLDDKFTENDRAMVAKAIQKIESKTCIRIIPRTTEENYILVRKNLKTEKCNSNVGMHGGKQMVNLAQRCITRPGSTTHEFMHSLGFIHEHSRIDRDDYVVIHFENIIEGHEGNFKKQEPMYANLVSPYDILSITHYPAVSFSKNDKHTIDPIDGSNIKFGQRKKLTELDIEKVNKYYNCDQKKSIEIVKNDSNTNRSINPPEGTFLNNMTRKVSTICTDFDESSCQWWEKYGYCNKSPMFMSVYCKETCNKCDMGCVDMNTKCRLWASKKYCNKYLYYMHHYCAKSCRIC